MSYDLRMPDPVRRLAILTAAELAQETGLTQAVFELKTDLGIQYHIAPAGALSVPAEAVLIHLSSPPTVEREEILAAHLYDPEAR